jgi:hypothetical protein
MNSMSMAVPFMMETIRDGRHLIKMIVSEFLLLLYKVCKSTHFFAKLLACILF